MGPSAVLAFVLGRLLLSGLFCPIVNIGVAALELISIGGVCTAVDDMFMLALYEEGDV